MKLKSQLIISIIIFGLVVLIVSGSIVFTDQQIAQIRNQEQIANDLSAGASSLAYISNDYFLYQQINQENLWQQQISALSNDLAKLNPNGAQQQILINNVGADLQRLGTIFNNSVALVGNIPQNDTGQVPTELKTVSSRLAVQNQALAFDASILSTSFEEQADRLKQTNSILIFTLLGAFGAYFATLYFVVFRRTFGSIAKLQKGTKILGSGNLDYSITIESKDEIGQLSHAFNQMASNLKTMTASKTELEQEIIERKRAEKEIENIAKFPAENPNPVLRIDNKGKILYSNENAALFLDAWKTKVTEQAPEHIKKLVAKTLENKERTEIEEQHEDKTFLLFFSPIPSQNYTNIYAVNISKLKTAEEELKRSEQRWATTLSSIGDSVIATNLNGEITFMNKVAEQLTGWTLSEALGTQLKEVFHIVNEQTRMDVESPVAKVLEKGIIVGLANHTILIRRDGGESPIDDSAAPVKDENGKVTGVVLVFHDITNRKILENKVKSHAKNLEKIIEERTKQLKDSERLATIGATAGMVGHDIRNPLQAITGDVFLLKTDVKTIPEGETRESALESLEGIEKNIDYINKIVQDLQDYARPLNPQFEETNLTTVIKKFLSKKDIPENIKATIKVENVATKINADPHFINRIMYNLITNSVQAMPTGGRLTIKAFKEEKDIVITVRDTGIGIPKDIQQKMFTPMFTTKSKGQGFGLPVVKRMTEALGGQVTFESKESKGTKFTLRFPQKN